MGRTTSSYGFVKCPKCGLMSQLKLRRGRYYYIDHYEENKIKLLDTQFRRN